MSRTTEATLICIEESDNQVGVSPRLTARQQLKQRNNSRRVAIGSRSRRARVVICQEKEYWLLLATFDHDILAAKAAVIDFDDQLDRFMALTEKECVPGTYRDAWNRGFSIRTHPRIKPDTTHSI